MIKTVEDFIRSFITSTNDIPVRKPASLDAEQLVDLVIMMFIEVNGGHDSDEDGGPDGRSTAQCSWAGRPWRLRRRGVEVPPGEARSSP